MIEAQTRWNNRSAGEWLEEAAQFERMAKRFENRPQLGASFAMLARDAARRAAQQPSEDLDYFRMRAEVEQKAADAAEDLRARRAHFELAARYRALITEQSATPSCVSKPE